MISPLKFLEKRRSCAAVSLGRGPRKGRTSAGALVTRATTSTAKGSGRRCFIMACRSRSLTLEPALHRHRRLAIQRLERKVLPAEAERAATAVLRALLRHG